MQGQIWMCIFQGASNIIGWIRIKKTQVKQGKTSIQSRLTGENVITAITQIQFTEAIFLHPLHNYNHGGNIFTFITYLQSQG